MRRLGRTLMAVLALLIIGTPFPLIAQDTGTPSKEALERILPKRAYSPYAGRNFPSRPLFGDTHLHTSASLDAGAGDEASLETLSLSLDSAITSLFTGGAQCSTWAI